MKPGDLVQIKQLDSGFLPSMISEKGIPMMDPIPMTFWIYATVHEALPDGAFVEVNHPGNAEHGARKKVLGENLRTFEDIQALHDAHPAKDVEKLDLGHNTAHREINNLRVALSRMKPEEKAA
jgi:hypothetical protein